MNLFWREQKKGLPVNPDDVITVEPVAHRALEGDTPAGNVAQSNLEPASNKPSVAIIKSQVVKMCQTVVRKADR
ncbi:hypothetical protein ANAEL_04467 [Anaerolineales bacterium]|nr:hypothetical protein ANAEL_04467 [Anaerolineales bacterium]